MIEVITGERGYKVIRLAERLTASRVDPVSEASKWIARHPRFLTKVKTIFVLGLGSGYHVQQLLAETTAQIVVIEPDRLLVETVSQFHTFPEERVRFENASHVRTIRASALIRRAISRSFIVLSHPSSKIANASFFRECAIQLNGRDWGSLTWQWQIKESVALDAAPRVDSKSEALSIYDLENTELVQNSEERERMLLKALRELVK